MVELVDTLDLGSSAVRCVGSSPSTRTKNKNGKPIQRELDGFFRFYRAIETIYSDQLKKWMVLLSAIS